MVMSRSTSVGSIVTGIIILTFAVVTVICGAITTKKLSGQAAASAGLWSLFYVVPGILSISAGVSENGVVMGFALFFNILAVIFSAIASVVLIIFTAVINRVVEYSKNNNCQTPVNGMCKCDDVNWNMNCDDLGTLRTIVIIVLIVYIILTVTTFVASIFGCLGATCCTGTCCAPADPDAVDTTGAVNAGGTTVVVASIRYAWVHKGNLSV